MEVNEPQENYITGWVKIYRSFLNHSLWSEKPYTRAQAFLWMIITANHKPNKFLLGNQLLEVKRGEFVTSQLKLSETFGWDRKKIRGFLSLLESDKMIAIKTDNKYTKITICNYATYQDFSPTDAPTKVTQPPHKKDSNSPTNNNDNNVKEWKEVEWTAVRGVIPPPSEYVSGYCAFRGNRVDVDKWYNHYESKGWVIGKSKMKDWQAAVRTWEEKKPEKIEIPKLVASYSENPRTDL